MSDLSHGVADRSARSARFLGVSSTVAIGLLPKLTCPLCWPAYTATLSALGLGFVDYTPYLLPLTGLFLAVSLAALALTARIRRQYTPLVVGALAGAVLLVGKFGLDSDVMTYAGIGLFVIAPFLPALRRQPAACSRCVSTDEKEAVP